MTNIQQLADQYLATWNETDPAARRKLIDTSWAADLSYTDPLVEVTGRDALDATIGAVQQQFPGLVFTLGETGVDGHHQQARFTWNLGPADGEALVVGFDVVTSDAEGRIATVLGFLDKVPTA
ncbi:nuclear transport factor 2 family protein [Kitasatospora viridis]|uniref:SnoaL-like protein n=1 Tax=Kitasatospora viridis TaxID=281105 RepID=A0A561UIE6_9ACTN|nr:nuclear transport factor 2 family protein [Kitasatospora viridis]TWF99114.1 SnoaL-like protein [Kitasatospora viridis]